MTTGRIIEVNIENDLNAVNDQITRLVDELNKINNARESVIQQVQNLQGVAMYLRGKLPEDAVMPSVNLDTPIQETEEAFDRSAEYPDDNAS